MIGLSILSGSHGVLVLDVLEGLKQRRRSSCRWWWAASSRRTTPRSSRAAGVARVYTPKDFDLTRIMGEIVDVVTESLRCRLSARARVES